MAHVEPTDISDFERQYTRDKLLQFIFPNTPVTAEEKAAFERAVLYQIAHDREMAEASSEVPTGATSFTIGHFSVELDKNATSGSDQMTKWTVCSAAYGVLLYAGLLYKGVERVRGGYRVLED